MSYSGNYSGNYSGLTRRFAAFVIDCLALITCYMVIGLVSFFSYPMSLLPMIGFWWYGGLFALSWLYFALMESSRWQATLGKKVLNLKVTDEAGERIGFKRATVRYFSKFLSRLLFCLGFVIQPRQE